MTSPREFFCQIPASLVRDGAGENPAAVRRFRHLVRGVGERAGPICKENGDPTRGASTPAANSDEPACEKCGGSGMVNAPNGLSGLLCPCGAWVRRYWKKA